MNNFWENLKTEQIFRNMKPSSYITQEIQRIFQEYTIKKVLDLGCGAGRYLNFLCEYTSSVYAMDLYDNMSKNIDRHKVRYKNSDMSSIPFRTKFDLILSTGVLHNANSKEHLEKTIQEIARHLNDGGVFLCSVFTNKLITEDLIPESQDRFLVQNREPMVLLAEKEIDGLFKQYDLIKIKEVDKHVTDVGSGQRFVCTALYQKKEDTDFLKDYSFNEKQNFTNMVLSAKFLAKRNLTFDIKTIPLDSYPNEIKIQELLHQISKKYHLNTKNIVLGAAANGIIQNLVKLFFAKGGILLTTKYSFTQPQVAVTRLGGIVQKVQHKDDLHIDFEKLLSGITSFTKAIFLCNPNNPTGFYENPKEIVNFSKKTSVPVIVSEAAIEFTKKQSLLDYYEEWPDNLIVVRTFSKAFGLAGLRVGYAVMKEKYFNYYRKNITRFEVSILSVCCAMKMLNDPSVLENVEKIIDERNYLTSELTKLGIDVLRSESNTLMSKRKWPKKFFNKLYENKIAVAIIEDVSPCCYFRIAIQDHKTNVRFIQKLKKLDIKEMNA